MPRSDSPMERALPVYRELARHFQEEPPSWLAEHLLDWTWSLQLSVGTESRLPTRSQIVGQLGDVVKSVEVLQAFLDRGHFRVFLEYPNELPVKTLENLSSSLVDIKSRAQHALAHPQLVGSTGKPRSGRGRSVPPDHLPAAPWCALLVAETFKHFNGTYPAASSKAAASAAECWWRIAGGDRKSWGEAPLKAWRRHFQTALSANTAQLPEPATLLGRYREHLRIRSRVAEEMAIGGER